MRAEVFEFFCLLLTGLLRGIIRGAAGKEGDAGR
jgi:hypothetical protein